MSNDFNNSNRHPYVPQRLAVKSMRDSGYENTAYAISELIDNSYQAIQSVQEINDRHDGHIDIVIVEERVTVEQRDRMRSAKIAVVDNGCGMTSDELRQALQFGNGTHLADRKGIGRFGMGLPNSTVSQCRRGDVWSWQTGHHSAMHSYIDLDEIESDEVVDVPVPSREPIPDDWLLWCPQIAESDSGTLVLWSNLDRVRWRTARSTLHNTETLIGRIYRKLLVKGLRISLTTVSADSRDSSRAVRVNDPLYLMSPSSTPQPFGERPMFEPWGRTGIQVFPVEFKGERHEVEVVISAARDEARLLDDGTEAGTLPYGKHARENVGVSIVRADRELLLDTAWASRDLRERWWGAEICFPPGLDEVFGVTNNKQFATHFTEMSEYYRDDRNDDEWQDVKQAWEDEDDPQRHLIEICNYLSTQLDLVRARLRDQTKGTRTKRQKRHDTQVEAKASEVFRQRAEAGQDAGDADAAVAPAAKRARLEADLLTKRYPDASARELAEYAATNEIRVLFVKQENPESSSFFHVEVLPGVTEVVFNTSHPAYEMLIDALDPVVDEESAPKLRGRIEDASGTLKLLFAAWARYEAEEKSGDRRDRLREMRQDWGRMAKAFLKDRQSAADPEWPEES